MAKETQLWTREFVLLCLVNFASWLSYNMVMPIMVKYVTSLGIPLSLGGIITGLFAFAALVSRPLSGILADKVNRKLLIMFSTLLMAVALFAYSISTSAAGIIFFRIIHGLAFGVSTSATLVAVGDSVGDRKLNQAITYFGITSILSMAIGPGIGIWISNLFGYNLCFRFGSLSLAFAAVIMLFFPAAENEEQGELVKEAARRELPSAEKKHFCSAFIETKVLVFCFINLVMAMFVSVISAYLSSYGKTIGVENVSLHFTVSAIVIILSRFLLARDDSAKSLNRKLSLGFVCAAGSLVIIACSNGLFGLTFSGGIKAVAQGVGQPVLQILTFRVVSSERRGRAGSTLYIGGDLGQTLGPVLGGVAADAFGYRSMFYLSIMPLLLGYLVHRRWMKKNKKLEGVNQVWKMEN